MTGYCAKCKPSERQPSLVELCEQHRLLMQLWETVSTLIALELRDAER